MIAGLFGPGVVTVTAGPEDLSAPLHPAEEACIERAVGKRRLEFAVGRSCARRALATLGVSGIPVLMGPDRGPVWPEGVIGSITHCAGLTAAVATRRGLLAGIGLDAEERAPLGADVIGMICTPEELQDPAWAKVIFSAKEAVHKCIAPVYRVMLDFRDVVITLSPAAGTFTVAPSRSAVATVPGLELLAGRFVLTPSHVLTGVQLASADAWPI